MKVHRDIGPGLEENVYQRACEHQFRVNGIEFESHPRRSIHHRKQKIAELIPDFVIQKEIILELKAIFGAIPTSAETQVLCYTKRFRAKLGFVVNFGIQSLTWKRLLGQTAVSRADHHLDPHSDTIPQNYDHSDQAAIEAIREIWTHHGPGYNDTIYHRLFEAELRHHRISVQAHPPTDLVIQNHSLPPATLPIHLIDNRCPTYIVALHKQPSATHIARMQTYLRCLRMPYGYIANFGRRHLQVITVKARR